jgi:hypothetical protein
MRKQELSKDDRGTNKQPSRDMWLAELEASPWARQFKAASPGAYAQALNYAQRPNLRVHVHQTDETGEVQWAISVVDDPEFWMDAKPTKKEAVALCRDMGWTATFPSTAAAAGDER